MTCRLIVRDVSPMMLGPLLCDCAVAESCHLRGLFCPMRGRDKQTIGYYAVCDPCNWADPTCHDSEEEARRVGRGLHP